MKLAPPAHLAHLALCAAIVGTAACDDPNAVDAQLPTSVDTLTVYALNNDQQILFSGISLVTLDDDQEPGPGVVRIDPNGTFDVALDINAEGQAVVYPVGLVTSGAGGRQVGIQVVDAAFDDVRSAPRGEYETDAPAVLDEGDVIVIEAESGQCVRGFSLGATLFAKLVVDSIRPATDKVYVRVTSDPNCGFRSFEPGIPRN